MHADIRELYAAHSSFYVINSSDELVAVHLMKGAGVPFFPILMSDEDE
jgi:hypothetical protein